MLIPTAGARFFVTELSDGQFPPSLGSWIEVREVEALGAARFAHDYQQWAMKGFDVAQATKGARVPQEVQIVTAADLSDPGQALLLEAVKSPDAFGFLIQFAEVVSGQEPEARRWKGLALALEHVFDVANSVTRIAWTLLPTSDVERLGGA